MNRDGIIITDSAIHYQILLPAGLEKITERQFGASKTSFIRTSNNNSNNNPQ